MSSWPNPRRASSRKEALNKPFLEPNDFFVEHLTKATVTVSGPSSPHTFFLPSFVSPEQSIICGLGLFTFNSLKCYLRRDSWCSRRFVRLFKEYLLLELLVQRDAKSINTADLQPKLGTGSFRLKTALKLAKGPPRPWVFINVQNALKGIININIYWAKMYCRLDIEFGLWCGSHRPY